MHVLENFNGDETIHIHENKEAGKLHVQVNFKADDNYGRARELRGRRERFTCTRTSTETRAMHESFDGVKNDARNLKQLNTSVLKDMLKKLLVNNNR
ncbi:hypothetical protein PoB_006357200 [Plakobranchus ocellatus]|uniref:Uncharacterized protein n=1 Tax=Plakobranchus ocellatus TaxID=259542 RepID=A0AAV4CYS0_9GAST|nr:hypothetical protein PoB_006357200 [Plakobranchus ocellatus]